MNDGLKYLVETIAICLNFVFAVAAFLMTLVINAKNRKIDNRLSSLRQILDKEIDLQVDSKRIGRDKVLALMVSIDKLLDNLKSMNDETFSDVDRYLKIELRQEYFDKLIYLPNNVSNAVLAFLSSAIKALAYHKDSVKYWDLMGEVSQTYVVLVHTIRKIYYSPLG